MNVKFQQLSPPVACDLLYFDITRPARRPATTYNIQLYENTAVQQNICDMKKVDVHWTWTL